MSEQLTTITLPAWDGMSELGKVGRNEMIRRARRYAESLKAEAESVLAAASEDFIVEQHRGVHVRTDIKRLEP